MSQDRDDLMDEFMGYPTFTETQDGRLRAFNRIVTFLKIFKEKDKPIASQYISRLSKRERQVISNVFADIKERGVETVRLEIKEGKRYA